VRKPIRLKRNSPWEARATPEEIIKTMRASLRFGSWMRKVQEIRRIATGVNACIDCGDEEKWRNVKGRGGHILSIWMYATLR